MSPLIVKLITLSFIALFLLGLIDYRLNKSWVRTIKYYALLVLAILILHFLVDYPSSKISYGGSSSWLIIILSYISMLVGMISQYFFNKDKVFDSMSFLKPFFISPIIYLPMLGVLGNNSSPDKIAILSIMIISFQNGFFWRSIYKNHESKNP